MVRVILVALQVPTDVDTEHSGTRASYSGPYISSTIALLAAHNVGKPFTRQHYASFYSLRLLPMVMVCASQSRDFAYAVHTTGLL